MSKPLSTLALCWAVAHVAGASIHVATTGDDSQAGTAEAPLRTIHRAVDLCQPGDTIWVHGGTYLISERIKIPEKATSPSRRCYLWAVPGDEVIIDGSAMHHTTQAEFKMGRCIYVNHLANYWHFKGLTLCNAEDNGMKVEGSYNIIEQCTFRDNNDTGLQIGMYKDFSIEETKSLPPGEPRFNPGYRYCRGNRVINCDSYGNYDARTYNGTDDGGDADGFACKLFPGPGTEFYGCRAWDNSDDNWDLYMVYHPVVIDRCWAYHAGYKPGTDTPVGNGNGFKLGGGGSAGGAAFDQSVGAHVVRRCVSFGNLKKGFDQNNAYEGMYIVACTAWDNDYNYRFPTVFRYGGMVVRNCVGFGARTLNHEFLSADKEGAQQPDTDFNSWTDLDGCNPYKEGQKVGSAKPKTRDYSADFVSLSAADFMAPRCADGSLPDNGFARLREGSALIDRGTPIVDFIPARFMTEAEAEAAGLTLDEADPFTLPYCDAAPDLGAYETDGVPSADSTVTIRRATLTCLTGNADQEVTLGQEIEPVRFEMGGSGERFEVEGLPEGLEAVELDGVDGGTSADGPIEGRTLVVRGTPAEVGVFAYTVSVVGGPRRVSQTGHLTVRRPSYVLTGGWYPLHDELSSLPADWQGIIGLIPGQSGRASYLDPTYTEQGTVPPGCTEGAIVMARDGGGVEWTFAHGLISLLVNLHFTGGRYLTIEWTRADGTSGAVKTDKLAKGTYCSWDVLEAAGLGETDEAITLRLLNSNSGGEIRLYDMLARVPDAVSSIEGVRPGAADPSTSPARDLFGRRVGSDYHGVVIRGGRKFLQ